MNINTIGSFTEICVPGGGNFLTESRPTNFHHFYTRKALTKGERPEDYMEVTAKERENIEKNDAGWQRPPQWVIDMFNADPNGWYNEETGYGELNGLTDLSAQDMMNIARWGNRLHEKAWAFANSNKASIRTNFTPVNGGYSNNVELGALFSGQSMMEVAMIAPEFSGGVNQATQWLNNTFYNCKALRKIIKPIRVHLVAYPITTAFVQCFALEEMEIIGLKVNITISDSPNLSLVSIGYMIENAANTSPIIVTLHPDAYARLTDELIAMASEKQIQFVTV